MTASKRAKGLILEEAADWLEEVAKKKTSWPRNDDVDLGWLQAADFLRWKAEKLLEEAELES